MPIITTAESLADPAISDVVWTSLLALAIGLAVAAISAVVVGLRRRARCHAALEARVAELEARLAQAPNKSSSDPDMKKGR